MITDELNGHNALSWGLIQKSSQVSLSTAVPLLNAAGHPIGSHGKYETFREGSDTQADRQV